MELFAKTLMSVSETLTQTTHVTIRIKKSVWILSAVTTATVWKALVWFHKKHLSLVKTLCLTKFNHWRFNERYQSCHYYNVDDKCSAGQTKSFKYTWKGQQGGNSFTGNLSSLHRFLYIWKDQIETQLKAYATSIHSSQNFQVHHVFDGRVDTMWHEYSRGKTSRSKCFTCGMNPFHLFEVLLLLFRERIFQSGFR